MKNRGLLIAIILAVFAWGTLHALGAYYNYTLTHNPWRPIMVMLFVDVFLAAWLVLLWLRWR